MFYINHIFREIHAFVVLNMDEQAKNSVLNEVNAGSKRSRTGWMPIVCKIREEFQMRIIVQRYDGSKGLFTSAPPASKLRPSWKPVKNCRIFRETNKENMEVQKFSFLNMDDEENSWEVNRMLPMMFGASSFGQICSMLIVERKQKLLSMYITVTCKSASFITQDCRCEETGLKKEKIEVDEEGYFTEEDIITEGGTLVQLKEFQKAAIDSALLIGNSLQANDQNDSFSIVNQNIQKPPSKMTKKERISANFQKEVSSESGIENHFVRSFIDFEVIHINNLKNSPDLYLQENHTKIENLIMSITQIPDPASYVLTVVPENIQKYENTCEDERCKLNFYVVSGRHRLSAFKEIHKKEGLSNIGLTDDSVPCFVCKTSSPILINYANIRSNDHKSKFVDTASLEDLILMFCGLLDKGIESDLCKIIVIRICHTRRVVAEDITALGKILDWPVEAVKILGDIVRKFQKYLTSDAEDSSAITSFKKGELNKMSKKQFRELSRCKSEFFIRNYSHVMDNTKSLKLFLLESEEFNKMEKIKSTISILAGNVAFSELESKHPEKLELKNLKSFAGAEVYGKKENYQGKRLKEFVRKLDDISSDKDALNFKDMENYSDIDISSVAANDIIIWTGKEIKSEWLLNLLKASMSPQRQYISNIIILPNEHCLYDLYKIFEDIKRIDEQIIFKPIIFEKTRSKFLNGKVNENIVYSVLLGKPYISGNSLATFNRGTIESELKTVITKLCPPSCNIAYLSFDNKNFINILTAESKHAVTYFGSRKCRNNFMKNVLQRKPLTPTDSNTGRIEEHTTNVENSGNSGSFEVENNELICQEDQDFSEEEPVSENERTYLENSSDCINTADIAEMLK